MRFFLLPHIDEDAWLSLTEAERNDRIAAIGAFGKELNDVGAMLGAYRPRPSAEARTVHVTNGEASVQDGPYARTDLQLSGVYIIEAPDLHAALSWATRNPVAAFGIVEVRPVWAGRP